MKTERKKEIVKERESQLKTRRPLFFLLKSDSKKPHAVTEI